METEQEHLVWQKIGDIENNLAIQIRGLDGKNFDTIEENQRVGEELRAIVDKHADIIKASMTYDDGKILAETRVTLLNNIKPIKVTLMKYSLGRIDIIGI